MFPLYLYTFFINRKIILNIRPTQMKKLIMSVALITATLFSASAKNNDPVLMTINGKDVHLSEFQYLYNKNNSQQMQQQTLDEYVDMFVTYKLKVADAEAAGIDTTMSFVREFNGYRNELARPYLTDKSVRDSLLNVAYNHMCEDVDVSHIMMTLTNNIEIDNKTVATLDSIRTAIINGASFEDAAVKYSIDRTAQYNKGRMGFISAGKFPYAWEDAAYNTPIGEISPVLQSPFGFHIVKVHGRRPNQGKALVQHILKLTRGNSPEEAAKQKARIDSIYQLVANGADFSDIAMRESQDPGSAKEGGKLRWFGAGEMVKPFEEASFALAVGEISKPVETSYGYHIIKKLDSKGIPSFEEAKSDLEKAIENDERNNMGEIKKLNDIKKQYNAHIITSSFKQIKKALEENGGYDSTFIKKYANSKLPIIKIGKKTIPFSTVIAQMPVVVNVAPEHGATYINNTAQSVLDKEAIIYETEQLDKKYPEFHNLLNEYRDGMLLFEISNRNVWDKAAKDKDGLEKYFQKNKYKYTWDGPKYKGVVIFATNDSICTEINNFLKANPVSNDSVAKVLRQQFGRNIKVERVIAAKGENAIIDYIAFAGEKPQTSGKWVAFTTYNGRKISMPEEASDVRGHVTSDYQAELEKEWVKSLREKYPVKINKKVLNKVK